MEIQHPRTKQASRGPHRMGPTLPGKRRRKRKEVRKRKRKNERSGVGNLPGGRGVSQHQGMAHRWQALLAAQDRSPPHAASTVRQVADISGARKPHCTTYLLGSARMPRRCHLGSGGGEGDQRPVCGVCTGVWSGKVTFYLA